MGIGDRPGWANLSGHLDWYAGGMFLPMHLDAELDAEGNVRMFEFGAVYR